MSESFQEFCKRILPVVQAGAEGKKIDFFSNAEGCWVGDEGYGFWLNTQYRIAEPKATPLPITPEMWALINPFYVCAVMTDYGDVLFCSQVTEWSDDDRKFGCEYGFGDNCKSPLNIDTTGIIPELSLTKRPDRYDATLDAWTYYKPAIDRAEGDGKGGVINKQFARAVPDADEVIVSIKKTAEDGRKHGVKIAEEEFSKERMIRDIAAGISGADYIVTEHYNPITGITQTIRTKIK